MSREAGSIFGKTSMHDLSAYPTVREAIFYEKIKFGRVKCCLCERRCEIAEGQTGFCRTRLNVGGKLYVLVYGDISAMESRPIEIKPFFHYWPGSTALTFSTWSCNFNCAWCQNFHLSKASPEPAKAHYFSPEKVVELALAYGDAGLCASFQEPTLLAEWALQVFRLGKERGIKYCCYVSNGYMTLEAIKALFNAGMNGLKIDVKGDEEVYTKYCGEADVNKVWRNVKEAKKLGLHIEVVNLIVTGVNDGEEKVQWIIQKHLENAGPETPLHFTRYFPAYKFHNPPTKVEVLEKAYEMAKKAGVLYPYLGNVSGHRYENTYCPNCGAKLIKRYGYYILKYAITSKKKCPNCGIDIPITGQYLGR
ncbi:MAG: AmmeMemoRadiSam system radical SAM enzyme [Nitrososphaerota archaeon]|nr:AmmeMemoRadiSam system radical SAM enzyme [Candidatus Bathyarchaeota archaeon]MDW8024188.1 AmmeMemoRadiSam system radical SAM enzyme [Nitrososphaerota archaeon]